MPLISFNLRNLLLVTVLIGSLIFLFVLIGPQGISPATGMSSLVNGKNFENLNLRAKTLPVENVKGGDSAPGVTIKTDNVNVMNTNIFYRLAQPEDQSKSTGQVLFLLHGAAFTSRHAY